MMKKKNKMTKIQEPALTMISKPLRGQRARAGYPHREGKDFQDQERIENY